MSSVDNINFNDSNNQKMTESVIPSTITTSMDLARYLGNGGTLEEELPAITSSQQDMKSYLSLYARSQLIRIEKLTNYLDQLESKMMNKIDDFNPKDFISAMQTLQCALSNAIELVKMVGTDDKYLSIIYNDNKSYIENMQVNNKIDIGLSRESRDKLRSIISKIKLENPIQGQVVDSNNSNNE